MNKLYPILIALICVSLINQAQPSGFDLKEKVSRKKNKVDNIVKTINAKNSSSNESINSLNYDLTKRIDLSSKDFKSMFAQKDVDGRTLFFEGQLRSHSKYRMNASKDKQAQSYLKAYLAIHQNANPKISFRTKSIVNDESQDHIRLQQTYKNIPLFGKEVIVHFKDSEAMAWNGQMREDYFELDVKPSLKVVDVMNVAKEHLVNEHSLHIKSFTKDDHLDYSSDKQELIIYDDDHEMKLAYHVTARPDFLHRFEYFVDAHSGEILNHFDHTCSFAGPKTAIAQDLFNINQLINTYEAGGIYYLLDGSRPMFVGNIDNFDGGIVTLNMNNNSYESGSYTAVTSNNNLWNNRTAVSAHVNGAKAYEYFINMHGRNSINGKGGNIVSFINVAEDNFGTGFDNAFWNGTAIFYGNGRSAFKPLARGLDVAGHEMSHGVISNSANLTYQGESGAINESMADVFGSMIDREDWLIGEDVVQISAFPSGALRSMIDPHNGGNSLSDNGYQPKHYDERYRGSEDNGGVHINSGIPNHAFYLVASDIGKDKAERIYYHALTRYLTASSRFVDLRIAVERSATDLYGNTELNAVRNAFNAVGIAGGQGGNYEEDIETLDGDEFILSIDLNNDDPNTLYISPGDASGFAPVSQRGINRKPSVTDDGSRTYFVGSDNHIYSIELAGNFAETRVSNTAIWDNAAVSKDGGKLAAITTEVDSSIYVFDLTDGQGVRYKLYNPTFTEGINGGGQPQYADALEWDYTGQFVMYDAYNLIDNQSGEDFDYWDVGFIQVWDNSVNDFGNGTISKLFSSLPEGISIGNPSFSKNSPYIVAFDEIDQFENPATFSLIAANIERNEVVKVYDNVKLSFPNYSLDDRKIIFDANGTGGSDILGTINMQSDKISPTTAPPEGLIGDAKWGIYYGVGERQLPTSVEVAELDHDFFRITPNLVSDVLYVNLNSSNTELLAELVSVDGKILRRSNVEPLEQTIKWNVSDLAKGAYFLRLVDGADIYSRKFVKE